MSVKVRHYNESTLHVLSGIARQEQLEAALKAVFKQIRDHYPDDGYESAHFVANVISDTKGNIYGYSYVWVSDPRIYYMLIGRNPDGSERFEEYEDPDWKPPSEPRPEVTMSLGVNWADVVDEEEDLEEKYTRPIIRRQLPPLVRLPGYRYDDEQLKKATEMVVAKASPEEKEAAVPVPTVGYFESSRSWVSDVDEEDSETTLCCRVAPTWVDAEMVRPFFERYSSDRELRHGRVDGVTGMYSYPVITFGNSKNKYTGEACKMVYVLYSDLCPHDASFALQMTRKITIENLNDVRLNEKLLSEGKPVREVRKTLLVFSHWRKTPLGRPAMAPAAGRPTRTLPTIALTTAPRITPGGVARVSGVTGRVTEWIQPSSAPVTSVPGIRTASVPTASRPTQAASRSTQAGPVTPVRPPVVSTFKGWGKPK